MLLRKSSTLSISVVALVATSIFEFVFSRLVFNIGLPLLGSSKMHQFDAFLSFIATFSVQLGFILSSLVLALAAWTLLTNSGIKHLILAVALLALVSSSLFAAYLQADSAILLGSPAFFSFALLAILVVSGRESSFPQMIAAGLFGLSYFTSYSTRAPLILELVGLDTYSWHGTELFQFGELLTLAIPLILYMMFRNSLRRRGLISFIIPSIVAIAFSIAYVVNPWVVSTVAMLTVGFSLFLPFPLYAVSLWIYTYVILGSVPECKQQALGLALVLLAGRRLAIGYLGLIAVVGAFLIFHGESALEKPKAGSLEVLG